MFYFLLVLILPFLIYQAYHFLELKKHDDSLYNFCALRRDSIEFINKNYENMSRNDYVATRKLISALDITIKNYRKHKTTIFNMRRFERYLKEFKQTGQRTEKISTNNPELIHLVKRMHHCVFHAFLSYTPFLKSEIVVKFMLRYLSIVGKSGKESIKEAMQIVEQESSYNGHHTC